MKVAKFQSNGPVLIAKAEFIGLHTTDFSLSLYEKDSMDVIQFVEGDNLNSSTVEMSLPLPPIKNDERVLRLYCKVKATDPQNSPYYKITLSVFQNQNQLLEFEQVDGDLPNEEITVDLYLQLSAQ